MPVYTFDAEVTISLTAEIEAASEADARAIVEELRMPPIKELDEDDEECWNTSGELDGEACAVQLTGATTDKPGGA